MLQRAAGACLMELTSVLCRGWFIRASILAKASGAGHLDRAARLLAAFTPSLDNQLQQLLPIIAHRAGVAIDKLKPPVRKPWCGGVLLYCLWAESLPA